MKTLKLCLIILINTSFIFTPQRITKGCGGGEPDESYFNYSFLDQTIINQSELKPFMLNYFSNYELDNYILHSKEESNINEWKSFFENQPEYEDIRQIVYKASIKDMEKIKSYVKGQKVELSSKWNKNTLIKHWAKSKSTDVIDYLIFAKKCEPHVVWDNYWSLPERDFGAMQVLIDEGSTIINKCKSEFLTLRYAYQIIRLAHYSTQYEFAIEIYDKIIANINYESILKYWSLGHRAGATKKMFNEVEAAYLFSKVFDNCPSQRISAIRSFEIYSDPDWEECLSLCKNVREKTTLYLMRGLDEFSNGVEEMAKIYELDPKSEQLEILLVREVKKMESELFGNELKSWPEYYESGTSSSLDYLEQLNSFVITVINGNNTNNPDLWLLSSGYLDMIAKEYDIAAEKFSKLRDSKTLSANLKKQLRLLELALKVNQLDSLDDKIEDDIYKQFVELGVAEHEGLWDIDSRFRFMLDAFAELYKKQGQDGKAFLCKKSFNELLYHPRFSIVKDLLKIEYDRDKTQFEKYLCNSRVGGKEKLLEMKGTILMGMGQLEEAIATFKLLPNDFQKSYNPFKVPNDPFLAGIVDCINCGDGTNKEYTKLTLAENLLKLEALAIEDKANAAQYYILLGNAYYNMTYFGKSWMASAYYRSGSTWGPNSDCSYAMKFYKKAIKVATDKELAAKACFMAAKCEQNMYYVSDEPKEQDYWVGIFPNYEIYRSNFKKLRDEFNGTNYYNEVINECKYFNYFVN